LIRTKGFLPGSSNWRTWRLCGEFGTHSDGRADIKVREEPVLGLTGQLALLRLDQPLALLECLRTSAFVQSKPFRLKPGGGRNNTY